MANVYYKILGGNIRTDYTEHIITGIQRELYASAKIIDEDLFDVSRGLTTKRSGLDVDSLLKYYVINQLLKTLPANENDKSDVKKQYVKTAHNKYYKNVKDDKYYEWSGERWVIAAGVSLVNNDGSYVISEKQTSAYTYEKLYGNDDILISMRIINPEGKVVSNMAQVVELLNLRQEYVLRYKYSGYSGNSNDIVASILNKFSSPIETGFYMDKYYNLFKWNKKEKSFIKVESHNQAPLLIDYDFGQSRKVIKKEYTGIR